MVKSRVGINIEPGNHQITSNYNFDCINWIGLDIYELVI